MPLFDDLVFYFWPSVAVRSRCDECFRATRATVATKRAAAPVNFTAARKLGQQEAAGHELLTWPAPQADLSQSGNWSATEASMRAQFQTVSDWARGDPIYVGEFGCFSWLPDSPVVHPPPAGFDASRVRWARSFMALAREFGFTTAYFDWHSTCRPWDFQSTYAVWDSTQQRALLPEFLAEVAESGGGRFTQAVVSATKTNPDDRQSDAPVDSSASSRKANAREAAPSRFAASLAGRNGDRPRGPRAQWPDRRRGASAPAHTAACAARTRGAAAT